jgi:5'-3' exonuclease
LGEKDAMVVGEVSISKSKRPQYADMDIEKAEELGAVWAKTSVELCKIAGIEYSVELDSRKVQELYKKGVVLPISVKEVVSIRLTGEDD